MRKLLSVISVSMVLILLSGCAYKENGSFIEKTDFLLDTVVTVRLYDGTDENLTACMDMIKKYDAMFSSQNPSSDVAKINEAKTGEYTSVNPETVKLISIAKDYSNSSGGRFDLTIGAVSSLWDFRSDDHKLPDKKELEKAVKTVGYDHVHIKDNAVMIDNPGTKIDLGGIAKGYITDRLRDYLLSNKVSSASISLGGNVYILGEKSPGNMFTVGIQKPFSEDATPARTIQVKDKSVVTSGVYQRYFKSDGVLYHHLLDTKTGYPIDNGLYSVTIVSNDSTAGDALSTAVFAMGLKEGMDYVESTPGIDAIFITSDYEVVSSSGLLN